MRSPKVPWWPGSVTTDSGLHLHHLVWGIVLLLLAGFLGFATTPASPWTEILAGAFGIGAGLTLDEFALWVYLRDVYWAEEGRSSFDAVVVAALIGGLTVLGLSPFDLPHNGSSVSAVAVAVVMSVLMSSVAILKGKPLLGLIGLFVLPVSLVGAVRVAAPDSRWATRRDDPAGRKMARAQVRWQRIAARRRRVADAIAGTPGVPAVNGTDATPAGKDKLAGTSKLFVALLASVIAAEILRDYFTGRTNRDASLFGFARGVLGSRLSVSTV